VQLSDYHITIGNATDTGKVREQNEDYLAHFDTPLGYCIIICDGMGGHVSGQLASQTAIAAMQRYLEDCKADGPEVSIELVNAIEFANFQLRQLIKEKPTLNGMGTTCVMALIKDGKLYAAHAGDSRIYLARKKKFTQITKDHSSVQQLIDEGIMTKEEAGKSTKKNQIVKAIGIFERVMPSVLDNPIPLLKNDMLLLCSDGLTDHLADESISEEISKTQDVQTISLKLIELANNNGGADNVTVQLVNYLGSATDKKINGSDLG